MSNFKIYLAGQMSNLTFQEMNEWRVAATQLLNTYADGIRCINPCDFYSFENDPSTYTQHEVKRFDLIQVKNCDLVLVNLSNSIGTAIELHEAHDNWYKPVIGFGDKEVHPWIDLSLTKRCKTLEDAIDHIIYFYVVNK